MRKSQKEFLNILTEFKKLNMSAILPGISQGDHVLLQTISSLEDQRGGRVKVSQVVKHLGMPPPAVSRGLRVLDQKGYIEREVDQSDRRNTFVTLTEEGRRILAEADLALDSFSDAVLAKVGEETMEKLYESFHKFVEASGEELENIKQQKGEGE